MYALTQDRQALSVSTIMTDATHHIVLMSSTTKKVDTWIIAEVDATYISRQ